MIGDEVKHEDIIEKMRGAPRYMPTIKVLLHTHTHDS